MSKCRAKLQPWQVFAAAIKTLSVGTLGHIFSKSNLRTVYLYGQNPATTAVTSKNPLEAIHMMFYEMNLVGRGDVAQCGLDYLATALTPLEDLGAVVDLQPTIEGELLKDHTAVGKLQTLVEEQADPNEVKLALHEAIDELNRTYAKYLQDLGK